jgi:Rrf2 family protein
MSLDQSLAVAANSLCVVAFLAPAPVPATKIAEQIIVNPVVIRRVMGKLVAAGLVRSLAGVNGGYLLTRQPSEITLQEVFAAISEKGIFERANSAPQAACVEGEGISRAITSVFAQAEDAFAKVLQDTTLDQLLAQTETA